MVHATKTALQGRRVTPRPEKGNGKRSWWQDWGPLSEDPATVMFRILEEVQDLRRMVCQDLTVQRFAELTAQASQTVRRKIRDRAWLIGKIPVFAYIEGLGWRCRWEDYLEWRRLQRDPYRRRHPLPSSVLR